MTVSEKRSGLAWHIHHDVLIEWTDDIRGRIAFIETQKPIHERPLRLALLKLVADPDALADARRADDDAGRAYNDAWRAADDAGRAYNDARRAYADAWRAYADARRAYNDARRAYNDAWRAYADARRAYNDARRALQTDPATLALHERECPGCPWNGKTIFPEAEASVR